MKLCQKIFCLGLTVLLAACSGKPDDFSSGEELYNYHCAGCHKKSGDGKFLMRIPANKMTRISKADVTSLIKNGHSLKPKMPPIEGISYSQAQKITDHLWTLKRQD